MIKPELVGYGKMGKMIESIAPKDQFTISGTYDVINPVKEHLKNGSDVAIEFSTPASVIENIEFLSSRGIDVVCGTTGWYNKAEIVKDIFFNIIKNASKLMSNYPQYDTGIKETHHTQKLDKPSGTAIRIAEYLLEGLQSKTSFVNDSQNPETNEINIISERLTDVVGRHEVDFESEADTISLVHNAKSRRGFAEGALLAAKFINGKKGFYKFEDIFCDLKI